MESCSICPLWPRLISLSVMSSRFIHVVGCTRIFFLFKADYYSTVRTEHALLFIHLLDTWVFSQASVFLKLADVFLWRLFFWWKPVGGAA